MLLGWTSVVGAAAAAAALALGVLGGLIVAPAVACPWPRISQQPTLSHAKIRMLGTRNSSSGKMRRRVGKSGADFGVRNFCLEKFTTNRQVDFLDARSCFFRAN